MNRNVVNKCDYNMIRKKVGLEGPETTVSQRQKETKFQVLSLQRVSKAAGNS